MVDLEQFREAVKCWRRSAAACGSSDDVKESDRLLSIIDNAGKAGGVDDAAARVWEAMQEAGYLYSGGPLADAHPDDQQHARRIALAALRQQPAACDTCDGRGWIDEGHEQDDGRMVAAPEDCPRCKGSGHKAAQQPAAVVDDAMVQRALNAKVRNWPVRQLFDSECEARIAMRSALTAALSSVQGVERG